MAPKPPLAKEQIVKLIVGAGQASPSPPVGPALGSKGVKSIDFCKVPVPPPLLAPLPFRTKLSPLSPPGEVQTKKQEFNARTSIYTPGTPIPTLITIRPDRSFHFALRTPTTSYLLLQAAGVKERKGKIRGGMTPGKGEVVGEVSLKHVFEIARIKQTEERLKGVGLEGLCKSVVATARSCGVGVVA